jgi:Fe-S-cluster-containing hydrogenase component 2
VGDSAAKAAGQVKGTYTGVKNCRAAKISAAGIKLCAWGCIGYGDCQAAWKFGAISMKNGLPVIDPAKCTGCRACIKACPQGVIRAIPKGSHGAFAVCNNRSVVKPAVKKACSTGCIKCEICVKKCPNGALTMKNGIPECDYSKCTSCGDCVNACPQKVLTII